MSNRHGTLSPLSRLSPSDIPSNYKKHPLEVSFHQIRSELGMDPPALWHMNIIDIRDRRYIKGSPLESDMVFMELPPAGWS